MKSEVTQVIHYEVWEIGNMDAFYQRDGVTIYNGDCVAVMESLPAESVNCCVTSPPYYGLRDYCHPGQIGRERTPDDYVKRIVEVFRGVRRVLAKDGTLWLNLGDSYQNGKGQSGGVDPKQPARRHGLRPNDVAIPGLKSKDLIGIPWMVAFALRNDGWYLRNDIIWDKPNCMCESVRDRCTRSHEYIFLLSKSKRYYFNQSAILEPVAASTKKDKRLTREGYDAGRPDRGFPGKPSRGAGLLTRKGGKEKRNKRSVWTVTTKPYKGAHFATFPMDLIEPCIMAGCPAGGVVLDPFGGAMTTALVARKNGCECIATELNEDYCKLGIKRLEQGVLKLA
jgi:DNA modification methylase